MISAAFTDPILQAQSAFRAILEALARPGMVQPIGEAVAAPSPLSAGAAAVALTLCDHDTPVWVDGGLRANDDVAQWLRFHCGCPLVENPRDAAFAFVRDIENLPPFEAFNLGTAEYPDRSTTIVLQVESLASGAELTLEGPGIRGRTSVCAKPLPAGIAERLTVNRALFPRGVDLLLVTQNAVAGLPRSVRIVED
jgi:alpha-D-ribose 1-methylphosphonate 5-triphosphate synthase subunit PhnH